MQSSPKLVIVHPIVLLSVVDHFNRVVKDNRSKRVVGALVGTYNKKTGEVDVANSFAVPFEEDPREPHVWFLDHLYLEAMFGMVRRVNAREKIVGWYTTGNRFKQHDIEIHEILKKYCNDPVFVIVNVDHKSPIAVPTEAYYSRDEVASDGQVIKNFVNIASTVEACEPEEVGVEHLVREIKNINLNSLSQMIQTKINSLNGLIQKMQTIFTYLEKVVSGKEKVNNQEIFNLLPNLNDDKIIKSFFIKNNDMMFVIYISSLIRSTIALHDLIQNKLDLKEQEKQKEAKKKAEKEEKKKADEKEKQKKIEDAKKEESNEKEKEKDKDKMDLEKK